MKLGWLQGTLLLMTVLMGSWWNARARLQYNEEGRWLDEENLIVYEVATVELLGIAFLVSIAALVVSFVVPRRPYTKGVQ